jgi:hypothetical protein
MEQMIWFLRVLTVFLAVVGISTFSFGDPSLTQSTMTNVKFEPAIKTILAFHGIKSYRVPSVGESLEAKWEGEDVKFVVKSLLPNQQISWEIVGLPHTEVIYMSIEVIEKENTVLLKTQMQSHHKSDFFSRLNHLFFGSHSLKAEAKSIVELFPTSKP